MGSPGTVKTMKTDRVRLYAFMKKRKDITLDEFHSYWLKSHSRLFCSLPIVQKNILHYEQGHTDHVINDSFATTGIDLELCQWDGVAIFEAESWDKIMEVFNDPEYLRVVVPDEKSFFDREAAQLLPVSFATVLST